MILDSLGLYFAAVRFAAMLKDPFSSVLRIQITNYRPKRSSFVSNCGAARCWSSSRRCLLALFGMEACATAHLLGA